MDFKVGVGKSDFEELRESGNYYVDKTELIYELVNDTDNKVTLFTRPRRFGKTLMMSMMENFFSIRKDSGSIFEGLAITGHSDFCKEWMNQYPVLFVSFKDVEAEDFDGAYEMLKVRLADISKDLSELVNGNQVNKYDCETLDRLQAEKSTS
ncbi:MAG: AAA family ATPase, partial [Lachnospiraceae bacterium]|nr:AAA family ATPase [Lachnospiraceae bacterium]